MLKKNLFPFVCILALSLSAAAQQNWRISPFENTVFIENKGQFDGLNNIPGSSIEYAVDNFGTRMFFTKQGITYRYNMTERENERNEKEENRLKVVPVFAQMDWVGSNPGVTIIAENKVPDYYSYPDERTKKKNFIAGAYKKIIYKNLYPNIDAVYEFPERVLPEYYMPDENRCYVEYSFIVHPGGNPDLIKMKYSGDGKVNSLWNGDISISTAAGEIIHTAPKSFDQGAKYAVFSDFLLSGKTISFSVGHYDKTQTLVIDPWTINPSFPGVNKAYDIDKDASGNLLVAGGSNPYYLKKFTPTGSTLLWTYTWTNNTSYYGDHVTELSTGNIYISCGPWLGSDLSKIDANANLIFNNTTANPTYPQGETYRLTLNQASGNLYGGGFAYNGNLLNACTSFNINTSTGNYSNLVNPTTYTEIRSLANDAATGNVYALAVAMPSGTNQLFNLAPVSLNTVFNISSGYALTESQATYCPNWFSGFNGVAVGCDLYTYDGSVLMHRDKTTGALINQVTVAGGSVYGNSGIFIDGCGSVYVGTGTDVKKYDGSLNLITTAATPGTVFDICDGNIANEILVVGNGFVSSINMSSCPNQPCSNTYIASATSTGPLCNGQCTGTATVNTTGGTTPYTYAWSNSATVQTITGLCAGTYTVLVTDNTSQTVSASVTITQPAQLSSSAAFTNTGCATCNGTASLTASGGTSPYSFAWSNSATTQSISNLCAGSYTATVTDANGCTSTASVSIIATGTFPSSTTFTSAQCAGQCNGTASVTPSGGTSPYTYAWSNSSSTQNISNLCAGTYTVLITDVNNCTSTASVAITQPAALSLSTAKNNPICTACNGTASVNASGGVSPYSYLWSSGQTTSSASALCAGTYTVTITDLNNCTATSTVSLTATGGITAAASSTNLQCFNNCIGTASVSGSGGSGYTYQWSNGKTTSNITGLCAGTYTVLVQDVNGCTATQNVTVTQPPQVTAAVSITPCTNDLPNASATVNASGGVSPYSYFWLTSPLQFTQTATGLYTGSYQVIVVDNNNCPDTLTAVIDICPNDSIFIPNVFTPNGDGTNDLYFIYTEGYKTLHVDIYDRWGLLIYEWADVRTGWNGKTKSGKDAPDGTYYYVVKGETLTGKITDQAGFLMLLRNK